jgi:hypothetical protein
VPPRGPPSPRPHADSQHRYAVSLRSQGGLHDPPARCSATSMVAPVLVLLRWHGTSSPLRNWGWQACLPWSRPVISRISSGFPPLCRSTPILLPQECCERRSFLPACAPAGLQRRNRELTLSVLRCSVVPLHTGSPYSGYKSSWRNRRLGETC